MTHFFTFGKIRFMTPKEYIMKVRELTIRQAAKELGVSRPYLTDVVNGKAIPGKRLCEKLETWSDGALSKESLMWPK